MKGNGVSWPTKRALELVKFANLSVLQIIPKDLKSIPGHTIWCAPDRFRMDAFVALISWFFSIGFNSLCHNR